ncbi:hypothetical protein EJB05_24130, partial [Eragrostis curvula]
MKSPELQSSVICDPILLSCIDLLPMLVHSFARPKLGVPLMRSLASFWRHRPHPTKIPEKSLVSWPCRSFFVAAASCLLRSGCSKVMFLRQCECELLTAPSVTDVSPYVLYKGTDFPRLMRLYFLCNPSSFFDGNQSSK